VTPPGRPPFRSRPAAAEQWPLWGHIPEAWSPAPAAAPPSTWSTTPHQIKIMLWLVSGFRASQLPYGGHSVKKQCVKLFGKIFEKSWLHSGVNETDVQVTAVSMTPLCTSQRCYWHRWATNFLDYLQEFEAIFEKDLTRVPGAQRKLYSKKK
jgi:hypothetical protein